MSATIIIPRFRRDPFLDAAFARQRIAELWRLIRHRYGGDSVPDSDAGSDLLAVMIYAHCAIQSGRTEALEAMQRLAPWMPLKTQITEVALVQYDLPALYAPEKAGEFLDLTAEEAAALKIETMTPAPPKRRASNSQRRSA